MYLALGVGLLAAAAVLFAWAYAAHRRPAPARWTGGELFSSGVCVAFTTLVAIGGGCLAVAILNPLETVRGTGPASLGLAVLSVALAWVLVPRLLRSVAPASSAPRFVPPRSPGPRRTPGPDRAAARKPAPRRAA